MIRQALISAFHLALAVTLTGPTFAQSMNFKISTPIFHLGALDGSAGVSSGGTHFVAATDEENTLRLFSTADGKEGTALTDLNQWEPFPKKLDDDGKTYKEADLEGATRIGDIIYWISSHANNSKGKARVERQVLFATKLVGEGADTRLETVGKPYTHLLEDIGADAKTKFLKPYIEAKIAPKEKDGFNIESLCAVGGQLYIGLRNPIIDGKALLVPLTNPHEVVQNGARALLGEPIPLFLGGLGFRDMVKWRDRYLIVAGDYRDRFEDQSALAPKLFLWSGKVEDARPLELKVDLLDLNPEAALVFGDEHNGRVLILSDDGKFPTVKKPETAGPAVKQFRSVWLEAEN